MSTKKALLLFLSFVLAGLACACQHNRGAAIPTKTSAEALNLPAPRLRSAVSIEETLSKRRSVRDYADAPLTLAELSQLLWAAQGITDTATGFRTAPSAGALYPLEIYVVVGRVEGMGAGVYKYRPSGHMLIQVSSGDIRPALQRAALSQPWVGDASAVIIMAAVYQRTIAKYGERGVRYVDMEAGHAAQNVCLQAVALNLGTVPVGAFQDEDIKRLVAMSADETPLYLLPVGKR